MASLLLVPAEGLGGPSGTLPNGGISGWKEKKENLPTDNTYWRPETKDHGNREQGNQDVPEAEKETPKPCLKSLGSTQTNRKHQISQPQATSP